MVDWKDIENATRGLLKTEKLAEAEQAILHGLNTFPDQIHLLIVATDVYRANNNYEKSLKYSQLIIKHYPEQSSGYIRSAQDLMHSGKTKEAQETIERGIKEIPGELYLLIVAREIFRQSGNREKCLEYSHQLITNHPNDWRGYGRAAQDLVALERHEEAQTIINAGLEAIPNQLNLLIIALDVYRTLNDPEKSLKHAELLIRHHPEDWNGYGRAAGDLIALKRFEEAERKVKAGLRQFPHQAYLKKHLAYANSFLGIRTESISEPEKNIIQLNPNDIISYSSVPSFFELLQSKRNTLSEEKNIQKKHVFIAGLGRSGTTALGEMLNLSSSVEIYNELYLPFRINGYLPSDFSENKIKEKLQSHPHKSLDANTFKKHKHSKIIGDKRPYFQFCAESTFDNISKGGFKCIFIDRSLIDICRSSHKRAENIRDYTWDLERGIEHTILFYNASCRQIMHLHANRSDVFSSFLFPAYENIFSITKSALELMVSSGIELTEKESGDVKEFVNNSRKYVNKQIDPSSHLDIYIKESIARLLDHEAHENFCAITGNWRSYSSK